MKAVNISEESHRHLLQIMRRMSTKRGQRVRLGGIVEHLIKTYGDKDKDLRG